MNVGAILSQKGRKVITVTTDTSLLDVARHLAKNGIGSIVVLDNREKVAGIISERDIVRGLGEQGPGVLEGPVTDLMTAEVITCRERDTVDRIMSIMSSHRFRHMPVVENERLVGIISIGDVVKTKIATAEMEARAMREYIVSPR